jgi:hypothetical protein
LLELKRFKKRVFLLCSLCEIEMPKQEENEEAIALLLLE